LSNSYGNFQLHRFTTSENIAKSFRGGYFFLTHTVGTKMSVLWPSKDAKIRFRPGLCPGPCWGSSRRSSRPLSRLERGHPSPYTTPLDTDPSSALAMRPPRARSPARSTPMDARCVNSLLLWALNYLFASHFASRGRDTLPAVVHLCVHAETEN